MTALRGRPARRQPARNQSAKNQPHALVRLVSRLMIAQAVATSAIGLGYLRRNVTGLLFG